MRLKDRKKDKQTDSRRTCIIKTTKYSFFFTNWKFQYFYFWKKYFIFFENAKETELEKGKLKKIINIHSSLQKALFSKSNRLAAYESQLFESPEQIVESNRTPVHWIWCQNFQNIKFLRKNLFIKSTSSNQIGIQIG